MKTESFLLPSYLSCYLFYGDTCDLTESEQSEIDDFMARNNLGEALSVSDTTEFSCANDLNYVGGDCATFTFPVLEK